MLKLQVVGSLDSGAGDTTETLAWSHDKRHTNFGGLWTGRCVEPEVGQREPYTVWEGRVWFHHCLPV